MAICIIQQLTRKVVAFVNFTACKKTGVIFLNNAFKLAVLSFNIQKENVDHALMCRIDFFSRVAVSVGSGG